MKKVDSLEEFLQYVPEEYIEDAKRIIEEENVPDVYCFEEIALIDLQFLDRRVIILVKGEDIVVFSEEEVVEGDVVDIIVAEIALLREIVSNVHKGLISLEYDVVERREKDAVKMLYRYIVMLLDAKRDLSYFEWVAYKLRCVLDDEDVLAIREEIRETLGLVEQAINTGEYLLDVHDRMASLDLNFLIKRLTAISIILAVLTIITGIYGMNFVYIPLAEHPQGFWIINAFMVALFIILWLLFRQIGWM